MPRRVWWLAALVAAGVCAVSFLDPTKSAAKGAWRYYELRRVERYAPELRAAAAESGVDANLLAAIMFVESGGEADAVSRVGALGLFQLMETSAVDAARKLGLPRPTRAELLADGALNARLAAVHVAWLIEHEGPDLERVLVAYNAGRTKLLRWIRADGSFAAWRARQEREGDSQVLAYARKVLDLRERFARRGRIVASEADSE
jgi:soluble lytic murein transglycosylase-like protein